MNAEKYDRFESTSLKSTEEIYSELASKEFKPVKSTVSANGAEQRELFLGGEIVNPDNRYPLLESISEADIDSFEELGGELVESTSRPIERRICIGYVDSQATIGRMMFAMNEVKQARDEESYDRAALQFMGHNIAKYGKPELGTYRSLLIEKSRKVLSKSLGNRATAIQGELEQILPEGVRGLVESGVDIKRYSPSPEVMEWMGSVAHELYGDMLDRVPDKDEIDAEEMVGIFQNVIEEDFGFTNGEWSSALGDYNSINVDSRNCVINVPRNRAPVTSAKMRGLVAHELGIHMSRAVSGFMTDIGPLAHGLDGYLDAEEGLGMVMEQALEGKFREAGADHYISAGLAFYDDADFRQMFEVKWRMKALEGVKEGGDLTDETINKARDFAYKNVTRSLRGTDSLPWFKDLSYYNGSVEIWKYLESIIYDEFQLSLLMQGKVGTSKEHQRVILESRSI